MIDSQSSQRTPSQVIDASSGMAFWQSERSQDSIQVDPIAPTIQGIGAQPMVFKFGSVHPKHAYGEMSTGQPDVSQIVNEQAGGLGDFPPRNGNVCCEAPFLEFKKTTTLTPAINRMDDTTAKDP